jgi:hypothetical protein
MSIENRRQLENTQSKLQELGHLYRKTEQKPTNMSVNWRCAPSRNGSINMRRIIALLNALVLLGSLMATATCVKAVLNFFFDPPVTILYPSYSAADAKWRGSWVCNVEVSPRTLVWEGHEIEFGDIWVEDVVVRKHFLVWYPYWEKTGERYLCMKFSKGYNFLSYRPRGPRLSLDPPPPSSHQDFALYTGQDVVDVTPIGKADIRALKASLEEWPESKTESKLNKGNN